MTEQEHGSVAMGDSMEEDGMPERIWAGDFDGQGFGHCVAGMQGGLYEEYVRADLALPVQEPVADLPQDVINLVVAAREFWDIHNDMLVESAALDKALEPFSSKVRYANEPDDEPLYAAPQPAHGTSAMDSAPAPNAPVDQNCGCDGAWDPDGCEKCTPTAPTPKEESK